MKDENKFYVTFRRNNGIVGQPMDPQKQHAKLRRE